MSIGPGSESSYDGEGNDIWSKEEVSVLNLPAAQRKHEEFGLNKLREELLRSRVKKKNNLDHSQRFKMDAINRFLNNSTRRGSPDLEESMDVLRKTSTPKVSYR